MTTGVEKNMGNKVESIKIEAKNFVVKSTGNNRHPNSMFLTNTELGVTFHLHCLDGRTIVTVWDENKIPIEISATKGHKIKVERF